ncbi:MAG: hypothetical protein JXR96_18435 [Deltaproteobacteria bacterium]|nr:hypothetical protein [Deltaproteobacteria bacterium]
MSARQRKALGLAISTIAIGAGLLLACWAMGAWMRGSAVVATLFAPGAHVPAWMLLGAIAFVALRLCALVFLPGFVLYRAVRLVFVFLRADEGVDS